MERLLSWILTALLHSSMHHRSMKAGAPVDLRVQQRLRWPPGYCLMRTGKRKNALYGGHEAMRASWR
uniref:Uncharacterized protein n=1 Tax=Hyaloperonospora arabidopsidis (strain Emoy2) TaxID=559515 RepID=M4C2U4_HYAAE